MPISSPNHYDLCKGLSSTSAHENFAAPEEWCRGAQRHRQAPAHKGPNSGISSGPLYSIVRENMVGCANSRKIERRPIGDELY
jgi:hypothetical protein